MGMFDTVMVPCPRCGIRAGFQSKGGDCSLAVYDLENCSKNVLSDVNRHAPAKCESCGTLFEVGFFPRSVPATSNSESREISTDEKALQGIEPTKEQVEILMKNNPKHSFYTAREELQEKAYGGKPPHGYASWGDYWKSL